MKIAIDSVMSPQRVMAFVTRARLYRFTPCRRNVGQDIGMDGISPSSADYLIEAFAQITERSLVEPKGLAVSIGDPRKLW